MPGTFNSPLRVAGCALASSLLIYVGFVWLRRKKKDSSSHNNNVEMPQQSSYAESRRADEPLNLIQQLLDNHFEKMTEDNTSEIISCVARKVREPLSQIDEEELAPEEILGQATPSNLKDAFENSLKEMSSILQVEEREEVTERDISFVQQNGEREEGKYPVNQIVEVEITTSTQSEDNSSDDQIMEKEEITREEVSSIHQIEERQESTEEKISSVHEIDESTAEEISPVLEISGEQISWVDQIDQSILKEVQIQETSFESKDSIQNALEEIKAVDSAILEARVLPISGGGDSIVCAESSAVLDDLFANLSRSTVEGDNSSMQNETEVTPKCTENGSDKIEEDCSPVVDVVEAVNGSVPKWESDKTDVELKHNLTESSTECRESIVKIIESATTKNGNVEKIESNGNIEQSESASSPASKTTSNCSEVPSTTFSKTPSECSSDSGRGLDSHRVDASAPTAFTRFYFELPQKFSGKLIGIRGSFVNSIKEKTLTTVSVKNHPAIPYFSLVELIGSDSQIQKALQMIRRTFPKGKYPAITLAPVVLAPDETIPVPPMIQLGLTAGAPIDVVVCHVVNPGHIFVHQPTHPSYYKHFHNQEKINEFYFGSEAPDTPRPICPSNICVAPVGGSWYRAEVQEVFTDLDQCVIKLLDYGGYYTVEMACLKQIWGDFICLPFQATECYLANIVPLNETEGWSEEAKTYFDKVTKSNVLYAEVTSYCENGVPFVLLLNGTTCINRLMTVEKHAKWIT